MFYSHFILAWHINIKFKSFTIIGIKNSDFLKSNIGKLTEKFIIMVTKKKNEIPNINARYFGLL